jgi:peptidoglycan/LPS O-acetylase OafA/YrhL
MTNLVYGAVIMGSLVISLFFLNFWRRVRDRFFLFISFAFLLLAVNWLILILAGEASDVRSYGYLTRLIAFLLIIVAIVDKNRSRRKPSELSQLRPDRPRPGSV